MNGDGIVTAEEFTQAFLLGMAGGTAASKAIALGLKSLNPKLYNSLAGTTEQFRNMAKTNPKLLAELYKTAKDASVNMFAGAKAINANVGKLDDAMKLADDGKSEADIWKSTGWFKGDDGKWRFEVDDSKATVLSKAELDELAKSDPYEMVEVPLPQVFKHDELFANYPQLNDIKVNWEYSKAKGLEDEKNIYYGANYDPQEKLITVGNGLDDKQIKSSLLHEVQHAVQVIEGFSKGGQPRDFEGIKKLNRTLLKEYRKKEQELRDAGYSEYDIERMVVDKWDEHPDKYLSNYEAYRRLHGEAEARLTQTRADKGYSNFPYDDLDVPRNELIIRDGEGVMEMAKELEYRYLKDGNIDMKAIEADADKFIEPLDFNDFSNQFGTKGLATVETPAGNVTIDVRSQYYKLKNWKEDRSKLSGIIMPTLRNPLFVVRHAGAKKYYAPYTDKDGIVHMFSVAETKDGIDILKSNYEPFNKKRIQDLIEVSDSDLIYVRGSTSNVNTANHSHQAVENAASDESITKKQ